MIPLPSKANRLCGFPFHFSNEERIYGSRLQGAEQPPSQTFLHTSPLNFYFCTAGGTVLLQGSFCYAFDLPVHLPYTYCQYLNFKHLPSKHCILKIYIGATVLGTESPRTASFLRASDRGRIAMYLPFSGTLL